jgi:hypothetical protein
MLLPILATFMVLWLTSARRCGLGTLMAAAGAFGVGLSSLLWWLLLQLPLRSTTTVATIDAALWASALLGLLIAARMRRPARGIVNDAPPDLSGEESVSGALIVLLPLCALAAVSFVSASVVAPHGGWDAWAMWNAKARFLSFGSPVWRDGFLSPAPSRDYPLLVPLSAARGWAFHGGWSVGVPIALAGFFATGTVLAAGASIRRESTTAHGLLTAAFILACPAFITWAPSQYVDVPVGLYMLLTFVFTAAALRAERPTPLWMFAGLSAGLAAWTKNEGFAFLVAAGLVATLACFWHGGWRRHWRVLAALAGGAAPALIVLVSFKLTVYRHNDIFNTRTPGRFLAGFADLHRVGLVVEAMGRELWHGGASLIGVLPLLAVFVAISGIARPKWTLAAPALLTSGLMLLVHMTVYVVTPHNLDWHLDTSLSRVIVQLMPSMVWGGMMLARSSR